ncbi:hypothetical protein [Litoribacillus peritrichatus]|uniref:Uncharacterized protein n=1 Tax=Litoribacillus peritrichatus TaxID=718191 RepID=A0ABP7M6K1_9GAMM
MKTITSTLTAIIFASFASISVAADSKEASAGFNSVDQHASTSTYGKKADRKRDLTRI